MLPTSTAVSFSVSAKVPASSDSVIAFVSDSLLSAEALSKPERTAVDALLAAGVVKPRGKETAFALAEGRRVILTGLGTPVDAAAWRAATGRAIRLAMAHKAAEIALLVPDDALAAEAVACGGTLAAFDNREFRGSAGVVRDEGKPKRAKAYVVVGKKHKADVERGAILADAANITRTLAYRPGNEFNPPSMARTCQKLAKDLGLGCKVIDEKEAAKLGMGGLLAVGGGSEAPPRLIVLEYKPSGKAKKDAPILLVGKSITFDTGGISIKPSLAMQKMTMDKSGGMAVIGAMTAIARLKPNKHVVALLPAAENMPSGIAYRPGDVLTMYNGVTVEVTNTDAEGRLVLADALAWGIKTYSPSAVIDIATLTGASALALGSSYGGVWCNNDALFAQLQAATGKTDERIWRMPLHQEYRDMLKADVADIVNSGARLGSANSAAEFLHFFVGEGGKPSFDDKIPWAHIDMAGVMENDRDTPTVGKGPSGYGARLLAEFVMQ